MIATKGVKQNRFTGITMSLLKFFQLTIHYATRLLRHALALTICRVAKLKIRQYVLGSDSPNLRLAKVSRYTVAYIFINL